MTDHTHNDTTTDPTVRAAGIDILDMLAAVPGMTAERGAALFNAIADKQDECGSDTEWLRTAAEVYGTAAVAHNLQMDAIRATPDDEQHDAEHSYPIRAFDTLTLQLDRIRATADAMQTAHPDIVEPESLINLAGQIFEAASEARQAVEALSRGRGARFEVISGGAA